MCKQAFEDMPMATLRLVYLLCYYLIEPPSKLPLKAFLGGGSD